MTKKKEIEVKLKKCCELCNYCVEVKYSYKFYDYGTPDKHVKLFCTYNPPTQPSMKIKWDKVPVGQTKLFNYQHYFDVSKTAPCAKYEITKNKTRISNYIKDVKKREADLLQLKKEQEKQKKQAAAERKKQAESNKKKRETEKKRIAARKKKQDAKREKKVEIKASKLKLKQQEKRKKAYQKDYNAKRRDARKSEKEEQNKYTRYEMMELDSV